jgi:hypothetical protein
MFSRDKLLTAITEYMEACLKAKDACNPSDTRAQNQFQYELSTLKKHLQMTGDAGHDQAALERVIRSLERSMGADSQHWREVAAE